MLITKEKIQKQLYLNFIFILAFIFMCFSTALLGATNEQAAGLLASPIQCSVGIGGGSAPSPPNTSALVEYGFDEGQIEENLVHNVVMPGDVSWMDGLIMGNPSLIYTGNVGNRALLLNMPNDGVLDDVTVNYGEELTFMNGILVETRLCLVDPFYKPAYIIASQMTNGNDETTHWRFAIDKIPQEGYNLTFKVWFDDGTSYLIKYPIPGTIEDQWVNVAGSYDQSTGYMYLYWKGQQVAQYYVGGQKIIQSGKDPIRIGRGEDSNPTSAFEGAVDEVKIWGDDPQCYQLTPQSLPSFGGTITIVPLTSQTPFCSNIRSYPPGEEIRLTAVPRQVPVFLFYQWLGDLNYVAGSEDQKPTITIIIDEDTVATARFLSHAEAPTLTRFPVDGFHNTSVDSTCNDGSCLLACGEDAVAVSNDVCHTGAQDIFAEAGTDVIASQSGQILFGCNEDGGNWATIAEGDYIHHYTHLDRVCFQDASGQIITNLCADYEPKAPINCKGYFKNGSTVTAGQQIGSVGNSGSASDTAAHLHYAIEKRGVGFYCSSTDPFPFLYSLEATTSCNNPPAPAPTPTPTPIPSDPILWTEPPLAISPLLYPDQANSNVTILSGDSFLAQFNPEAGSDFWMGGGVMVTAREVPVGTIFYWDGATDTIGKRMCQEGGTPPNIDATPCTWPNTSDQLSDGYYCVADYVGPWTPTQVCQQVSGLPALVHWNWDSDLVRGMGWEQLAEDFEFSVSEILLIYYSVPPTPTPMPTSMPAP